MRQTASGCGMETMPVSRARPMTANYQSDLEPHEIDDSERLDDPISVRWTGYARTRIHEYNGEFEDDGSFTRSDGDEEVKYHSPRAFCRALERFKTVVRCDTVLEASSIRYELDSYDSSQRIWMNSSMDRALRRVSESLDDEMRSRGFEPVWQTIGGVVTTRHFKGYRKAD